MKPCKRIEIVIEAPLAQRLAERLRQLGAPGFTLIPEVRGAGDVASICFMRRTAVSASA